MADRQSTSIDPSTCYCDCASAIEFGNDNARYLEWKPGIPHVHGHRGNAVTLFLGKGGPESVHTRPLPTFGHVQHGVMGQMVHQGQALVLPAEGSFVHTQVRDLLRLAGGLNRAPLPGFAAARSDRGRAVFLARRSATLTA